MNTNKTCFLMKAKRHDAKEGSIMSFADIKRSGNTSVFVNGLEHIQGFQDGQELCDAAGKKKIMRMTSKISSKVAPFSRAKRE